MQFVNQIALIVHSNCVKYGGNPNKNIGDAFLFAWKLSRGHDQQELMCLEDDKGGINRLSKEKKTVLRITGDVVLFCILKIIAKINSVEEILEYRKNEALNFRLPGYTVKIGYGIHLGWAIEGMIGSGFKLDASYLSPIVNVAGKLEENTKTYGVGLLLSG
jgi:class 3 adenylate cyclase